MSARSSNLNSDCKTSGIRANLNSYGFQRPKAAWSCTSRGGIQKQPFQFSINTSLIPIVEFR